MSQIIVYGNLSDSDQQYLKLSKNKSSPDKFKLNQNYPNPFNPVASLSYDLMEDSFVSITVYDLVGNLINDLVSTNQLSGFKTVQQSATNNQGHTITAGLYFYSIEARNFRQTKK